MKRYVLLSSALWLFSGCGGCGERVEEPDEPTETTCEDTCLSSRGSYNKELCVGNCEISNTITTTNCNKLCEAEEKAFNDRNTFVCWQRCTRDTDGDGVYVHADLCPETPEGVRVNASGCADTDGDGISDDRDQCPSEGGTDIDPKGCPHIEPACPSGYCANRTPPVCTGSACDKEREVPLMKTIPEATRLAFARQLLSLRPARQQCPSITSGPRVPRMIEPRAGVNELAYQGGDYQTSGVYFHVEEGTLIALPDEDTATAATRGSGPNQVVDIPVEFASIEAECPPVSYSLAVDYYFCETLPGIDERSHYRELGFCTWTPWDYVSGVQPDTPFFYPFEQAKLLAGLYQPLMKEEAFVDTLEYLPSGKAPFYYRTLWLRFQVVAHDGNGRPSPMGIHTDASYLVLYTSAKRYELTRIPSEGF